MMNILDIQDKLKSLSQDQLANEMQMPSGAVPQFLVLGELNRRQSMRQSMQQQGAGSQTVAQEILNGAGVPAEGMSDMAGAMAPKSSIAQNTGIGALPQGAAPEQGGGIAALAPQQPMGMFGGGPVRKMFEGQAVSRSGMPITRGYDPLGSPGSYVDSIFSGISDAGGILTGRTVEEQRRIEEQRALEADGLTAGSSPVDPRESNAMTAPRPIVTAPATDPFAPPPPPPSGSGRSGGSGGSGPMSSYEKMLQDAMANAEKKAKQDKWLALAQAGMALMSSTSGSFAGALGEAGKIGIEALQGSRDIAEQNKLKLGQEMFGIEQARAAQARAAAASGQRRAPTVKDLMSQLNDVQEFINTINPPPDGISEPRVLSPAEQASVDEAMGIRDALVQAIGQMGVGAADLSDPSQ